MTPTFTVEMLPAREGDCLLLTWGDADHPHRLLVDGGRRGTLRDLRRRFAGLPDAERQLDLLIVTHVDRDHIEGVLALLADAAPPVRFADVWFNGYHHLHDAGIESFGPAQGERLSEILANSSAGWNAAFGGRSVEVDHAPEPVGLPGGLTLRVLAPGRAELEGLIPFWEEECRRAKLIPGGRGAEVDVEVDSPPGVEAFGSPDVAGLAATPFVPDGSSANASSIVLLAEFEGRRVLLTGDAHAETIRRALEAEAAASATGRVRLDALKVPHHGSAHNLSPDLVALLDCPTFLVSSNGAHHEHPHDVALARILAGTADPHLVFNYSSPQTLVWDDDDLRDSAGYTTSYPSDNGTNIVDLLAGQSR